MTEKNKARFFAALMVTVAIIGAIITSGIAYATPSQFTAGAASTADHAATTTVTYMTPGTATSTVVYDTQQSNGTNQTNNGNTYVTNKITWLQAVNASSTASVFNTAFEYSQDGITWYADNTETYAAGAIAIAVPNSYTWTYASTTPGGEAVSVSENRGTKAITVDVPTRYIRAVMSITGARGAIQGRFVPTKEIR